MRSNRGRTETVPDHDDCRRDSCVLCRVPDGALRYCEGCGRFGVEFGTFFATVNRSQLCRLLELSRHLLTRLREEPTGHRVGLRLGRPSVALLLDGDQLSSFHGLLSRGLGRARQTPTPSFELDAAETVN